MGKGRTRPEERRSDRQQHTVITAMLGMPESEETEMRELAHTLTLGLEPLLALQHLEEIADASDVIVEHVLDAIEWKRAHPADDLLTALLAAEADGDRLSPEELLDQVILLYIAGHETTVNLIGNGTYALLRNRAELERWRDDPSLDANAVEKAIAVAPESLHYLYGVYRKRIERLRENPPTHWDGVFTAEEK